ncbi:GSCOCG00005798001-RA-CDS [Cotesia congregata]|nr:GSCOCG00005798001-RA-CDS [Cotesia congregata]
MDPEAFLDLANQVIKLKMFPYFDIAHSVLCALHVREDLGPGAQAFSRKHPISCWLSTMLVVFAGGMLCNGLIGEPILAPLKNTPQVIVATVVWYVIFYTPFDIGYKVAKFLPVKILFSAMKEIYRCKKVYDGVTHAGKLYPNAYLIMILIGTLKGNGAGFTKLFERLIRGVWTPTAMEFMQPSFPTKACLVASIIFVLDKKTDLISAPHALVYFGIVIFFIYFKLSSILLGIHDPFVPFENLICQIFFGGLMDRFTKLFGRGQVKDEKTDAKKNKIFAFLFSRSTLINSIIYIRN